MRSTFLPFHRPSIGDEEVEEVSEALRSGWVTTGPRVKRFEDSFAKFVGSSHALAVNSCTAALHLALAAFGIKPGDEVIVPTMTFTASAEVVLYLGAQPVLVDCRRDTFNLDEFALEERITPKTRAVMPVHMAGQPCEMDMILSVAQRHGLKVIEDAAHSLPAKFEGRNVGIIGDITAFSFYVTKTITTGEGGMATTDNEEYAGAESPRHQQGCLAAVHSRGLVVLRGAGARLQVQHDRCCCRNGHPPAQQGGAFPREAGADRRALQPGLFRS